MAVTKQEEMLLAALRIKRARMRGITLSELEEEEEAYAESLDRRASSRSSRARDSAYVAPVRAIQKNGSKSSMGTIVPEHRASSRYEAQSLSGTPEPFTQLLDTAELSPRSARSDDAPAQANQEQVLLYLEPGASGTEDDEEPSPDLSDFMDFDNGSEDAHSFRGRSSTGRDTDDKPPPTPEDTIPVASSLSPKEGCAPETLCVVPEDDITGGVGIPRPDSPVSPTLPLSFPIPKSMRKPLRLSAVGGVSTGMEAPWWGDDG